MLKKIIGIIPARMASSRFPGKPLEKISGIPMVGHVYFRSKMCVTLDEVYVATCDKEIADYISSIGGKAIMTRDTHPRASDRAAEAMVKIEKGTKKKVDIAVMIQGDEPMVTPEMIDSVIRPLLENDDILIANLMAELKCKEESEDPNIVKVAVDKDNFALSFSRKPISGYKQIAIIPFRRDFLLKFNAFSPAPLEVTESVDMFRVLENGYRIKMVVSPFTSYTVDTPQDLKRTSKLMEHDPLLEQYIVKRRKNMKRKEILNVGIAGYGVVGKRRRQFIDRYPQLKTVAVCDQKFLKSGVMPDGVRFMPDYRKLLEEPLDILFVSLPTYMAAEVTIAGLKRGLHIFCEKPPGRDVWDIEKVIEIEKEHPKCVLKYGFNHRYHDSVREALRIIHSGELGDILNVRGIYGKSRIISFSSGWRAERKYSGGGILLDQGIHMVDLIRLFCGEIAEVKSFVSNAYWHHDVEDNAFALMRNSKGQVAMLHSSATQWEHHFHMYIGMTGGYLELRGILSGSKSYGEEQLIIGRRSESDVGTLKKEEITYLEDNSWRDEIYEFADAIFNINKIKYGNSKDALETMKLVYRIYYADDDWKKVLDIPDEHKKEV